MPDQVRPAQLDDWFAAHPADPANPAAAPLVLDVREPMELQVASVKPAGFELLHMPMNTIPGRLSELDPDRPVAVLCHHGNRSQHVAVFLERNGFATVANIAGGIDAWTFERDPSVPRY